MPNIIRQDEAEQLLHWARDSLQHLIDRDLIDLEESSAQELIDEIDSLIGEE